MQWEATARPRQTLLWWKERSFNLLLRQFLLFRNSVG